MLFMVDFPKVKSNWRKSAWGIQFLIMFIFMQEDPTLERHFKGHRDTVTSLDFNPNMKQLGESLLVLNINMSVSRKFVQCEKKANNKTETEEFIWGTATSQSVCMEIQSVIRMSTVVWMRQAYSFIVWWVGSIEMGFLKHWDLNRHYSST